MVFIDRLIFGGVRWVLEKVSVALEAELDDESALRDELLAAEIRLELGEITGGEFRRIEEKVLAGLREVRERRQGASRETYSFGAGTVRVAVEVAAADLPPIPAPRAGPGAAARRARAPAPRGRRGRRVRRRR